MRATHGLTTELASTRAELNAQDRGLNAAAAAQHQIESVDRRIDYAQNEMIKPLNEALVAMQESVKIQRVENDLLRERIARLERGRASQGLDVQSLLRRMNSVEIRAQHLSQWLFGDGATVGVFEILKDVKDGLFARLRDYRRERITWTNRFHERIAKLEGGAEPEIEAEPLVHDPEYGQLYGGHTYAQVKWMHEHGDWQQQGIQVPTAFEAQKWLNEDTTPRPAGL